MHKSLNSYAEESYKQFILEKYAMLGNNFKFRLLLDRFFKCCCKNEIASFILQSWNISLTITHNNRVYFMALKASAFRSQISAGRNSMFEIDKEALSDLWVELWYHARKAFRINISSTSMLKCTWRIWFLENWFQVHDPGVEFEQQHFHYLLHMNWELTPVVR